MRRKKRKTPDAPTAPQVKPFSNSPFEGLKKAIGTLPAPPKPEPPPPPPAPPPPDPFEEAMQGVRIIDAYRALDPKLPGKLRKHAPPQPIEEDEAQGLRDTISGKRKIVLAYTDEYLSWCRGDLPADLADRVHEGRYSVQAALDLHGLTLEEAAISFDEFMREARMQGLFCIKVIHGRGLKSPGKPVIREAFKRWIDGPYRKFLDAYATARPNDGGLGATYLILKGGKR